ncbi:MAG: DUF5916 domain-containing protein [Gemmatimonadota bacterium]|nr:DUF5916 domain-containing protein [Gemmatimonadota bacterium]MDH4347199.1 DUF5916 domain-containing protein [Gemmatimonadota bacterium]
MRPKCFQNIDLDAVLTRVTGDPPGSEPWGRPESPQGCDARPDQLEPGELGLGLPAARCQPRLGGSTPAFNFASPRGNAVFRWEYLPGSTLYLVWTTSCADQTSTGEFDFGGSLERLGTSPGEHGFAVKLSYWWHPWATVSRRLEPPMASARTQPGAITFPAP